MKFQFKNYQRAFFLLTTFLTMPFSSFAAPFVSSAPATITDGQSISISGSGFGTKSPAAPQLWDSVDNQASYSGLIDGDTIPEGGSNPWPDNQNDFFKLETTDVQHGIYSSKAYKGTGTGVKLNGKIIANTGKVYVYWWFKPSMDPTIIVGDGHSSKFLRLSNSSDPSNLTFSWTQMHNYAYRTDTGYCGEGGGGIWADWNGNVNSWNLHEVYIDGKNRTYKIMLNGSIFTDATWNMCSAFDFDEVWGIGWDSGGSVPLSMTIWMDDIYIDNTPQRVMICSGSTWAARGNCEIQIPFAWSDTLTTVTTNQGSFINGASTYLYVVDSNDDANANGHEISFSQTGDTTSPASPNGLSVS